jgi:hypothetical protein
MTAFNTPQGSSCRRLNPFNGNSEIPGMGIGTLHFAVHPYQICSHCSATLQWTFGLNFCIKSLGIS